MPPNSPTKIDTKATLRDRCLRLRNHNPTGWAEFIAAFEAYTDEVTVAVTAAPAQDILVMQGRAQQCISLMRDFYECERVANRPTP